MPIEHTLCGDKQDFFKMHLFQEIQITEDTLTVAFLKIHLFNQDNQLSIEENCFV